MKYAVGDKVRIRKDLEVGKMYDGIEQLDGYMAEERGKEGTITEAHTLTNHYFINDYYWSEEMIERKVDKMKATLTVDGKEIEVEITEEELEKLTVKKKTGYERIEKGRTYYNESTDGRIVSGVDHYWEADHSTYETANYYNDEQLAKDCARADRLLRQLRRFAVEHRKEELDWTETQSKYYIVYDYEDMKIATIGTYCVRDFGQIYFDSRETVKLAIDTFEDELEWYFTEFKDSL